MLPDLSEWGVALEKVAVILVDHGSRREESNQLLLEVAEAFRQQSAWAQVEPAHMELAEPSIATAFDRCAQQGAKGLTFSKLTNSRTRILKRHTRQQCLLADDLVALADSNDAECRTTDVDSEQHLGRDSKLLFMHQLIARVF